MILEFKFGDAAKCFEGYGDSDWAGCKSSLKSTSGGAVFLGTCLIKSWSTSQNTMAMSSGEAELYALTKFASQVTGMVSMASDFGQRLQGTVKSDSTAAIGIANRTGLGGRSRHVRVQYLWIQEAVQSKGLTLEKVNTKVNVADAMTKFINRESFEDHLAAMGYRLVSGRSAVSNCLVLREHVGQIHGRMKT